MINIIETQPTLYYFPPSTVKCGAFLRKLARAYLEC